MENEIEELKKQIADKNNEIQKLQIRLTKQGLDRTKVTMQIAARMFIEFRTRENAFPETANTACLCFDEAQMFVDAAIQKGLL